MPHFLRNSLLKVIWLYLFAKIYTLLVFPAMFRKDNYWLLLYRLILIQERTFTTLSCHNYFKINALKSIILKYKCSKLAGIAFNVFKITRLFLSFCGKKDRELYTKNKRYKHTFGILSNKSQFTFLKYNTNSNFQNCEINCCVYNLYLDSILKLTVKIPQNVISIIAKIIFIK